MQVMGDAHHATDAASGPQHWLRLDDRSAEVTLQNCSEPLDAMNDVGATALKVLG